MQIKNPFRRVGFFLTNRRSGLASMTRLLLFEPLP